MAISRDGALDYARGYGMANLEHDAAIAPDSVFQVASVAKQFTAFAILLLAQDGKLSLQDDIRKYLPELPDYGHKVTIAQLIHHTAGLREEATLMFLAGWRGGDPKNEADVLRVTAKQRALNFTPGSQALYSNTHYTLLGIIVRRVAGMPLREFAEQRMFRPLDMKDTRFQADHLEVVHRRAIGYRPIDGGAWLTSLPRSDQYGAGNLLTTVGDLLKWYENFNHARVGGRAVVEAMQASGTLNDGSATGYGGGLRIERYRGLRTIGHDGVDAGYRADAVSFPEQRLIIATLCNSGSIAPDALTRKIADIYLGDRLTPIAPLPKVKMTEAELSALAGVYWSRVTGEVVRVEMKDGALQGTGSSWPLVPIGHGVFSIDGPFRIDSLPYEWRFSTPTSDAPIELQILDSWPWPRVFTRLPAPPPGTGPSTGASAGPSAETLAAYAGRYRAEEVDMTYTVHVENGKLSMRWGRDVSLTLEAASGDHFVAGGHVVSFTRNPSGSVNGLTVSTRRVRRLRAERLPA